MIYAIIHRPKINNEAINEFRKKYDPNFKLIGPHVTLVFPFKTDNIDLQKLEAHIEKVAQQTKPFNVHFGEIKLAWDQILILTPTTGKREFDKMHDELYGGILKEFLRTDIEFLPHITLGYLGQAKSKYDIAINEIKHQNLDFSYTVDSIELISAIDDFTPSKSLKVFNFE